MNRPGPSFRQNLAEHLGRDFAHLQIDMQADIATISGPKLSDFVPLMTQLKRVYQFHFLVDIIPVDQSQLAGAKAHAVVKYHLLNMEQWLRLIVIAEITPANWPSVDALWKNATWYERECWDLFGYELGTNHQLGRLYFPAHFDGHVQLKRQTLDWQIENVEASEHLSAELRARQAPLTSGHPGVKDLLGITLTLEAECVRSLDVQVGYFYRGIEKLMEHKNFQQIISYTDRLNYCASVAGNLAWVQPLELALKCEVPARAMALRMIFLEWQRICAHLICLGSMAQDMELLSVYGACMNTREKVVQLMQAYSGARVAYGIATIGGVRFDVSTQWIQQCWELVAWVEQDLIDLAQVLTRSSLWIERTESVAISGLQALEWGFTGPNLRASGINYDVRKAFPNYFYHEVDFEVPMGGTGSSYDRYLVRMEEMHQSLKIIEQVLQDLPAGPICQNSLMLPDKAQGQRAPDLDAFRAWMELAPPAGAYYRPVESSNGELGFYVVCDGTAKPYRAKLRAPSFSITAALSELFVGHDRADLKVALSSLDIVMGEVDR